MEKEKQGKCFIINDLLRIILISTFQTPRNKKKKEVKYHEFLIYVMPQVDIFDKNLFYLYI
jgi:hypothetical protein